jgi:hypothetical protein
LTRVALATNNCRNARCVVGVRPCIKKKPWMGPKHKSSTVEDGCANRRQAQREKKEQGTTPQSQQAGDKERCWRDYKWTVQVLIQVRRYGRRTRTRSDQRQRTVESRRGRFGLAGVDGSVLGELGPAGGFASKRRVPRGWVANRANHGRGKTPLVQRYACTSLGARPLMRPSRLPFRGKRGQFGVGCRRSGRRQDT